jgi:hypothetical protein
MENYSKNKIYIGLVACSKHIVSTTQTYDDYLQILFLLFLFPFSFLNAGEACFAYFKGAVPSWM